MQGVDIPCLRWFSTLTGLKEVLLVEKSKDRISIWVALIATDTGDTCSLPVTLWGVMGTFQSRPFNL